MILCATGHRPNKLGGYNSEVFAKLQAVAEEFLEKNRPDKIITGMALGWDMAWAEAGIVQGIPVIAAVPFLGQEQIWPLQSQKQYKQILLNCSDVVYVCDQGHAPWKMQVRNEYMVDKSDKVIAMWNGTRGGTYNCIKYAEKVGKPIVNLWDMFEKGSNE